MVGGLNRDEHRDRQAELVRIQHGDPGADDAGLLHALDAFPAGRGGEADLVGDVVQRERCILGEEAQDGAVGGVEVGQIWRLTWSVIFNG